LTSVAVSTSLKPLWSDAASRTTRPAGKRATPATLNESGLSNVAVPPIATFMPMMNLAPLGNACGLRSSDANWRGNPACA